MNEIFDFLKLIFNENGFRLYMIGSTSRDFLLNKEIKDYDFVTDATPNESLKFIKASSAFKKYGVLKLKLFGKSIDVATLREETNYEDFRHPSKITFIKDISKDYLRRDLTINAIYINEQYQIEPISKQGVDDLFCHRLVFIGDIYKRINEDPLRILRAFRFMEEYNLSINADDLKILNENLYLIDKLNPQKVLEEQHKIEKVREYNRDET